MAIIYLAFISLGLPDSLHGSCWPVMHLAMGVPISYLGILSMVISGGTIVSSLFSDKLARKYGTRIVTVVSVFLTAIALFGFSISTKFWMLIVFAIPYGFGAGAIDASLNSYVALHYNSKHMSWLHCFWGVGTVISPFVMSYALTHSAWYNGYRIVSLIQVCIGIVLLVTLPVWKVNEDKNAAENEEKSVGISGALKIKGVPCLLIGFFAYCAAEATVMGWASTYLVEVKSVTAELAAKFGSLFFIGMTVGRFLGGFIMDKLGDRKMISFGTCVLLAGIVMLLVPAANPVLAEIGFVVIGLGCAPIYPCIIHSTPGNFGSENAGAIIGIQMASAYAGTTFMPPLFGWLGSLAGYSVLPLYLAVFAVLMILMVERTFRLCAEKM